MEQAGRLGWRDAAWLAAFGLLSSLWCVTAARQVGPTFDEPLYVRLGLEGWRTFSHAGLIRKGTMPLPVDVQTLPLCLWERCRGVPFDPTNDLPTLLPVARGMTLGFWWLLLGYALLLGRRVGGPWAGRLAVALVATEPSFLAHAALATTDVAVAALLLGFVYHFTANRDAGWWRRVAWPALWFGLAVFAKVSGLVFGGLCVLAVEAERLSRAEGCWRARLAAFWKQSVRDGVQIGLLGLALVFVACGSDWQTQPAFVEWAHGLPGSWYRGPAVWLAEHLCVFTNAGEGIVRQVKHNAHGHGVFLLGRTDPVSVWYYFPVLLTIKLTLTLLLLPLAVLLIRGRALWNAAAAAALALLLFSVNCRVQIGVRLVLPLVALAAVGTAAGLARACRELGPSLRGRLLTAAAAGGVAWSAVVAALVWPNGLCYVNEAWGGPERGYLLVSDSNYDWGQGLAELDRWREANGVEDLDVWYFGDDPQYWRLPMRPRMLHTLPLASREDVLAELRGRRLAVGMTLRYGLPVNTPGFRAVNEVLAEREPVARTTTFLIYDFRDEPKAAGEGKRPGVF